MLLVLASFLAGAPLEKLVCRPLSDPSRSEFNMSINIESLLEKMDVDLTSFALLSDEVEARLRKFKAAVQIDYHNIKTVASRYACVTLCGA
ncbi:hypothetical protein NP493_183g00022 [Ridgeia piscesae]|uniref:Uncharacterized protein n=1 Tax=Ridgeia piscesae TaxID=27915 RepID=A0AAD9P2P4_RIDPI|nr:hypothetical protein NP493_183g00022 [Ridgeia piscesae]